MLPIGAMAGEGEATPRVQHRGRDRAERVQEHLGDEEPQQVGGELLLLLGDLGIGDAGGEQPRELRARRRCPSTDTTPSPTSAIDSTPPATSSTRRSSPRLKWATKVGTSTADSAPAASSSNSTFETLLAAWNVLPR